MMPVWRVFGAVMLFCGSFLLSSLFRFRYSYCASVYAEMLSFLLYTELEIRERGTDLKEIMRSVSCPELEKCGFLPIGREQGLSCAFEQFQNELPLKENDKKLLGELFSGIGGETRGAELEKLARVISVFSLSEAAVRAETPTKQKTAGVLSLSCACLLVLLLI